MDGEKEPERYQGQRSVPQSKQYPADLTLPYSSWMFATLFAAHPFLRLYPKEGPTPSFSVVPQIVDVNTDNMLANFPTLDGLDPIISFLIIFRFTNRADF